jgi:uracil-DNA glycosylase
MEKDQYTPFELEANWQKILHQELAQSYIPHLAAFVAVERARNIPVFPPHELVFNAFKTTKFEDVKVLIVGQDPYHGLGQAHGLSFSVPKGVPPPPSLQNIFKELMTDAGITQPQHGCLLNWAKQGVMLLNATLTVRQGEPMSHYGKGWERFTDAVITQLWKREDPLIFLLWGKSAQKNCQCIKTMENRSGHLILTAAHPSPLSAHQGFFGCRHFSQANEFLIKQKKTPIDWNV